MIEWYDYIVECSDSTYYTGITTNIIKRIETHNSKKVQNNIKLIGDN